MKLQRAIAQYLADHIPDLYPFKDDIAWNAAGNPYPYLLITEIAATRRGLGSGAWDGVTNDSHPVKLIKQRIVLRFTVRAAGKADKSGGRITAEIADQVTDLFFGLCRNGGIDLPVPGSEPAEAVHVERIVHQGSVDLQPMESGEPFVHQKALTFAFLIHRVHEGQPAGVFSDIRIEKE